MKSAKQFLSTTVMLALVLAIARIASPSVVRMHRLGATSAPSLAGRVTPATATSSTARHIQIGMGALALSIAALMTVLLFFSARRRARGNTATLASNSSTPTAIRRLLGRAHNAWEDGSLWVALVLGLASGTQADGVLYVLAIVVPSGATFGTQVSAAIAFVIGMLAVIEIMLASYLATPAKTQAVVGLLRNSAGAHHRKVLVAIFAVLGVSLVAKGMGGL